jgi:hypothetical protein
MDYTTKTLEQLSDMEREAYATGDTDRADLLIALIEVMGERDALEDTETLETWERNNGPAQSYKAFFEDCFERLGGHYPAPSVTSDYDCSVIFDAIAKGEGITD